MIFVRDLSVIKGQPDVGDVHVANTGRKRRKKRPRSFKNSKITTDSGVADYLGKKWSFPLQITKADPEKRMIFGWASVVEKDGVAVIDKQGDMIPVSELENAVYEFVLDYRHNDDMHKRPKTGRLVESMVFTKEKQEALGIDLKKVAWWTGFKIDDEELWAAHKRGERPEFSIGGAAVPVDIAADLEKVASPASVNVANPQAPNVSVTPHVHMPHITLPEIVINAGNNKTATRKRVTTSRDADGNLTAEVTEVDDALAAD